MFKALKKDINNNILDLIWNNTTDAIFTIGYDGAVLYANPAFEEMLDWSMSEIKGIAYPPFISDISKQEHQEFINQLKNGKDFPYSIVKRKNKYGKELDILASYRVINNENVLAVAMYKDFTEQMIIQRKLEESEYCYRMLVEYLPEAIIKQRYGKIDFVNESGLQLFGTRTIEDVIGYSIWDFVSSDQRDEVQRLIDNIYNHPENHEPQTIVACLTRKENDKVYTEIKIIPIGSKDRPDIQIVFRDVTDKKQYESKLEYLAYHDPLTGFKNRRLFTKIVKESMELAEEENDQIAVLYIDIDKFKNINDTYGHDTGDQLLIQFSKRLASSVREQDVLCRVGGDEFLVLLKGIKKKEEIDSVAKRMIDSFQEPYKLGENNLQITSSIGISVFPDDGTQTSSLIYYADQALYKAKEGRNQYRYYH